ncbi:MAG: ribbon-helix-helix protein, CopG family [Desulfobulbaceae bacterium]|nr:ribbon-helix-helix protein, CopG family [Desulfobulbaceae bacterium]
MNLSDRYVPLSVRIPQYLLDRLEKVSQQKHQSRSEAVLEAINDYLFKNQKFWSTR